jgi:hypothetical protein
MREHANASDEEHERQRRDGERTTTGGEAGCEEAGCEGGGRRMDGWSG